MAQRANDVSFASLACIGQYLYQSVQHIVYFLLPFRQSVFFMKSHTFLSEYSLCCYIFMSEWSRLLQQLHLCFYERNPPPKEAVSCLWKVHLLLNEVSCHGHDIELQLVVEKAVARPIGNEATAL